MTQSTSRNLTLIFLTIGLALVCAGIVVNEGLIIWASLRFGISLNLGGTDGTIRIWALKTIFIVAGLPLLFYKYRSNRRIRLFFDLSMGLIVTVVLLVFTEGLFYTLNTSQPSLGGRASLHYSEPYVEPDELLGYKLKSDVQVPVLQTIEDIVIYEVVYSTDKNNRRATPVDNPANRINFILFFGGSYTFGDGVNDDETLPAYVGDFAPEYMPYNYGVPGYGTQQMLAKLQSDRVVEEIDEAQGIAIYNFICPHVSRVIGASNVVNVWGKFMPYYTLDATDRLVRKGDFVSDRPMLTSLYAVLGVSQSAKYFDIRLPRIRDEHVRLTARLIEESARAFREKFDSDAFYVLIYPVAGCSSIIPYLDRFNVKYLDYSTLFSLEDEEFWQPDRHPTAEGFKLVAEKLTKDIGITGTGVEE